jgi:DNA-binding MarR family transcriptional regulator
VRGRKQTPAGAALTRLVLEVFRLNGNLLAAGDRLTAPFGQSSARWQVLGALMDGPRTVSAAARRMGLTRQSVQRLADLLVEDGLCVYQANPEHRRAPLLAYTRRGEEVLRDIDRAQAAWVNQLAGGLGRTEIEGALKLLRAVSQRLEATRRASPDGHSTPDDA